MDKREHITNFSQFFLSQSTEKIRKGILLFLRQFLVSKSFMDEKGGITFFRRKFFVSLYRKIWLGNTSVYQKISGIENFQAKEGENFTVLSKLFV